MISFLQLKEKSFFILLIGLFLVLIASIGLDNDSYGYIELIQKMKNLHFIFNERIVYAISIKFLAIRHFYLYFVLLGMTQIRAGVAIGIFLLSIKDIYNRNFSSNSFSLFCDNINFVISFKSI